MKVQSISGRKVCTFRLVKLRRAQRHLSRARQGSRNREKARQRVAQIQERTAKLRQEFLHQLSYLIVITWSVICFADLSLKALARTKHAKSRLDAACGELLRQVAYKACRTASTLSR